VSVSHKQKLFWHVQGYDSHKRIFESLVPGNHSEKEVVALLKALAARHLTLTETVSAYLRKGLKGYSALLEPRIERLQARPDELRARGITKRHTISVGLNPWYVASVWTAQELEEQKVAHRT
jgi:hypothetical protein